MSAFRFVFAVAGSCGSIFAGPPENDRIMEMSYMEFTAMLLLGGLAAVVVVLVRYMLTERRRNRLQDGRGQ